MLIGIEASRANRLQKTGVEWYAYRLIQAMKQDPMQDPHAWILYSNTALSMGLERMPTNWHERRLSWAPKYLWTQIRLSLEMLRKPPEVLFVPAHVLPRFAPKRSVVTVHDVGFHKYPELYKPRQVSYHEWSTKDIVKSGAKIITVSEFCKGEIMEGYNVPADRITVTPLGVDHATYKPADASVITSTLARLQIPTPYVLFVGRLEAKKNILVLVDAFKRHKASRGVGDPLHLVLAGLPGEGFDAIGKAIADSGCAEFVHITGYLSEADKVALLSGALAYVQPSFYEGFGLPPLEAMACGSPVISSNAASLPEVVGEGNALFFDPLDPEALRAHLETILDQSETRDRLRTAGLAWAPRFRWDKTARQTLQTLTTW
ncbi:glycosyltransferase family 4 protein [Candidatus Uhrbacteria bacterium]|nr:glycosyltransferase family 4 protein [Candidatus Uhrbacteria bacterium]